LFKLAQAKFKKKYLSHSLNNAGTRISKSTSTCKNRDLVELRTVSSHLIVVIYQSRPCLKVSVGKMVFDQVVFDQKAWSHPGLYFKTFATTLNGFA
jgi:hypothetical protein